MLVAALAVDSATAAVPLGITGAALVFAGSCFGTLTITGDRDALALRYGPLPVFRKRFPYDKITAVRQGRSALIDGWGIHYIPGRGWTYNLWGYDCALLEMDGRTIRIGSDDAQRLVEFLQSRITRETREAH